MPGLTAAAGVETDVLPAGELVAVVDAGFVACGCVAAQTCFRAAKVK